MKMEIVWPSAICDPKKRKMLISVVSKVGLIKRSVHRAAYGRWRIA
jgi:hypothetical protein